MFKLFKKKKPAKISNREFGDVTDLEDKIIQACLPFTMTGKLRLISLIRAVDYLNHNSIEGDIVECGVWKGGSIMAAAYKSKESSYFRDIYLYDTFQGMTEPKEVDVSIDNVAATKLFEELPEWCQANIEEVKKNISRINYPKEKTHFIPGKVEQTVPENTHEQIALLRLDTDWYDSTKVELEYLFPKLSKGGILIIDDYGHWEGARKATDKYFQENNIKMFLNRVDYTCRIGVKL